MKVFITSIALLVFTFCSVQKPEQAHAGAADAVILLALIGGGVYLGYQMSETYEVRKKAALNIKDGKVNLQKPTLQFEAVEEDSISKREERYSLALVNLDF